MLLDWILQLLRVTEFNLAWYWAQLLSGGLVAAVILLVVIIELPKSDTKQEYKDMIIFGLGGILVSLILTLWAIPVWLVGYITWTIYRSIRRYWELPD